MITYYFSYDCKPCPEHPATSEFDGMIADVFIADAIKERAETRTRQHLKNCGWEAKELQHWELVTSPSSRDSRLSELFNAAQRDEIATLLSPYN